MKQSLVLLQAAKSMNPKTEGKKKSEDLTYAEQKQILEEYLADSSISPKDLAERHNIAPQTLTAIINNEPFTRAEIEHKAIAIRALAENRVISEIKEKALNVWKDTIQEINELDNKKEYVGTINTIVNTIDRMYRLNFELPTEIMNTNTKNQNTNINLHEIVKELKTPEEKMQFLLNQMSNDRNQPNNVRPATSPSR